MKHSISLLLLFLFLSCDEIQVEDLLSDFSTDNIPLTTINTLNATYNSSSVSISWAGNEYANSFSYRLEPLSYTNPVTTYANWSEWDTLNTVTFTNLDEGNYGFYIKSRFTVENEETPQSISFIVDAIAGPALRVYPLYTKVTSGENFSMYIYVEDVVDLAGMELHLSYPVSLSAGDTVKVAAGSILANSTIFFDTRNSTDGSIELISIAENFTGYTGSGILAKISVTAGETAGLDTLHIKDTSILRNSGNVSIDILNRMYGLIEVVE